MEKILNRLKKYQQILVTGPQRSGTTIATLIIAEELKYSYFLEENFDTDNLWECFKIYSTNVTCVVQAPGLSAYAHLFPGAVVFMIRPICEIIKSQKRVGWNFDNMEKAKYFCDNPEISACELKYKMWTKWQKRKNMFALQYNSLAGHKLWIDIENRKEFGARQTAN